MAYDVRRRPGEWVTRRAAHEERVVWLVAGLVLVDAAALVVAAAGGRSSLALAAGGLLLAVCIYRVGLRRVDVAARWLRGARAERAVGEALNELRAEHFVVMHDVLQDGEGNVDHVVSARPAST